MNLSFSPEGAVELTAKQANIYVWGWQPEARFRDAVCGRRFGKTFLAKAEMRRAARLAQKWNVSVEDEIWYAAPTFKQAKRVFWKRLKQAIPPSWRFGKPNETECTITLKSGHVIRVVGLDNYDDLRGSGLFFLIIDEWADCKWAAWEEVLRPMLSTCKYIVNGVQRVGGNVLRIGTPKGYNHCYDTWMDGQDGREPDHKSWIYTSLQGGNIPESEIDVARRKMDPKTFRQEYEASFETYQGVIYYCFERTLNPTERVVKEGDVLHVGMDFNVQKMAAVVYVRDGEYLYAVGEFKNLFDTPAMIEAIKAKYPDYEVNVYPDASGDNRKSSNASETDIALLKKAGFKVHVNSRNPAVKDRINSMNSRLCNTMGERRLYVNLKQCPEFARSLERQIYDEHGQPDKKAGFDHLNDAGTYPVAYMFPLNKKAVGETSIIGLL